MKTKIIALTSAFLIGCGGGTTPPDNITPIDDPINNKDIIVTETNTFRPEIYLDTSSEGQCIGIDNKGVYCFYQDMANDTNQRLNIYMNYSSDMVNWSNRIPITTRWGDEYDVYVTQDGDNINVLYSVWNNISGDPVYNNLGDSGNSVMLSKLNINDLSVSEPEIVLSVDTESFWDSSMTILKNGEYVVVSSHEGIEGAINGSIVITKSYDQGNTWENFESITPNTLINEEQPVLIEKDDSLMVIFREWNGYNNDISNTSGMLGSDIWYIESYDNGNTWSENKLLYSTDFNDMFSHITEINNIYYIFLIREVSTENNSYSVFVLESEDLINFKEPVRLTDMEYNEWRNLDPHGTMYNGNVLMNFSTAIYHERFDADFNKKSYIYIKEIN